MENNNRVFFRCCRLTQKQWPLISTTSYFTVAQTEKKTTQQNNIDEEKKNYSKIEFSKYTPEKKRLWSCLLWKFCRTKKRAMQRAQLICCNLRNSPF